MNPFEESHASPQNDAESVISNAATLVPSRRVSRGFWSAIQPGTRKFETDSMLSASATLAPTLAEGSISMAGRQSLRAFLRSQKRYNRHKQDLVVEWPVDRNDMEYTDLNASKHAKLSKAFSEYFGSAFVAPCTNEFYVEPIDEHGHKTTFALPNGATCTEMILVLKDQDSKVTEGKWERSKRRSGEIDGTDDGLGLRFRKNAWPLANKAVDPRYWDDQELLVNCFFMPEDDKTTSHFRVLREGGITPTVSCETFQKLRSATIGDSQEFDVQLEWSGDLFSAYAQQDRTSAPITQSLKVRTIGDVIRRLDAGGKYFHNIVQPLEDASTREENSQKFQSQKVTITSHHYAPMSGESFNWWRSLLRGH